jgi:acetyl-CoA carboxylase biotin carboxyl carrier protein
MWHRDGRTARAQLVALLREHEGVQTLCAPAVGMWRGAPAPGTLLSESTVLGELEVLGVLHELVTPAGIEGVVAEHEGQQLGERALGWGDTMVRVRALALGDAVTHGSSTTSAKATEAGKLVFRAPLSGRFYARSSPDKPAFVSVGDEIATGHTVALLEVMKTFNRLSYGGAGLPERARVRAVLVRDEDDVEAGAAILELEPI